MIFAKTQKIMKKGIAKYSKELQISKDSTQILVKSDENEGVSYTVCNSWKPIKEVTFKNIMDVKVDLLGFEMLASPFLMRSVEMYAKSYECEVENINLFIFEKNDKIGAAIYCGTEFKEAITLSKQFERLGI